jgi:hypothetical protein
MASMINDARAISAPPTTIAETQVSSEVEGREGLRLARYCALEEFVGLAFGIGTMIYIASSLAGLAP